MSGIGEKLAQINVGGCRCKLNVISRRRFRSCRLTLVDSDNSPWTQVVIVGFVCFCTVGMFSAIGGLGAGCVCRPLWRSQLAFILTSYSGTQNTQLTDTANAVLYALFAVGLLQVQTGRD